MANDSSRDNKVMLSYMEYIQNIFSNNEKLLLIATSLISTFTTYFTSFKFLQDMNYYFENRLISAFEFHFTECLKNEMTYKPSKHIY